MLPFGSPFSLGLVLWLAVVPAGDDRVLLLGDRLLDAGLIEEAVTEYKRYIFFNSDRRENDVAYAYARIAFAYRRQGRHDDAVEMLLRAIPAEAHEEKRDNWRIDLGVTEIARGRYDLADFTLLKVEMFSSFDAAKRRAAFFRGICNIYMGKPDEARSAFRNFAGGTDSDAQQLGDGIEDLLAGNELLKVKSPRAAKILSSVVPGLGEVYAGDWRGGVNAFAVNAATGSLLVHDLARRQFLDALVGSSALFARFYGGNRERAVAAANRFNERQGRDLVAEVLKIVEKK